MSVMSRQELYTLTRWHRLYGVTIILTPTLPSDDKKLTRQQQRRSLLCSLMRLARHEKRGFSFRSFFFRLSRKTFGCWAARKVFQAYNNNTM